MEGARLGKAEKERNLAHRHTWLREIPDREIVAERVEQLADRRPLAPELAVQGAPAHVKLPRDVFGARGEHESHLFASDTLIFLTYFNAGLRLYDIADATRPREVAYFIPPDPRERRMVLPETLVAQTEDVLVDARGYAYLTDKNQGIYVVRRSPRRKRA